MIERCSINVRDLEIFRRTASGIGGDGTDASVVAGVLAEHEQVKAGTKTTDGRDVTITDTIMIDGIDPSDGSVLNIKAHDMVQFTDWTGALTKKLSIVQVRAHTRPGRSDLAHVRLDIG